MSSSRKIFRFEPLESRRLLSAGSLDPTFGVGGVVVEAAHVTPNDMVVQSDGKILISVGFQVMRFNANGSLDTSFGDDGAVDPGADPNGFGFDIAGIAVQRNGDIVVGGTAYDGWAAARFTSSGALDTTFGSSGFVVTQADGYTEEPGAIGVAIESNNGNIIIGGSQNSGSTSNYAAICFTANGTLNTAFGTDGEATSPLATSGIRSAKSMTEEANGDIVIAGSESTASTNNGSAAAFSELGQVVTIPSPSVGGDSSGVAPLAVGSSSSDTVAYAIWEFAQGPVLQVGSTDNTFTFDPFSDAAYQSPTGLTFVTDTLPLIVGTGPRGVGLARFNSSGSIDSTFGLAGSVTLTPQMLGFRSAVTATNVAIAANGDILVAGYKNKNNSLFLASIQGGSNAVDREPPIAYCDPTSITQQSHKRYQFAVQYAAGQSINAATIGDNNFIVTGPRGVHERARMVSISTSGNVTTAVYSFRIDKLGLRHPTATLNINLRPNQVIDNFGNAVAPGLLGQFQP